MNSKKRILFLCTGNSCRSQMAEGFATRLRSNELEARSAGTNPQTLNPYAVKVMQELGIDISQNRSKSVDDLDDTKFDYVIAVCDHAHEQCPYWPGQGKVVYHGFDDPPHLAAAVKNEAEILTIYRRVRDQIKEYIETLPSSLEMEK